MKPDLQRLRMYERSSNLGLEMEDRSTCTVISQSVFSIETRILNHKLLWLDTLWRKDFLNSASMPRSSMVASCLKRHLEQVTTEDGSS
jgi:hypothetical protein